MYVGIESYPATNIFLLTSGNILNCHSDKVNPKQVSHIEISFIQRRRYIFDFHYIYLDYSIV